MFSKAIEKISKSIFPIMFERRQKLKANVTRHFVSVSGTGFFIDNKGLFVTANHVISNFNQDTILYYIGGAPENVTQPIQFKDVVRDTNKDIFIGKIEKDYLPSVEFSDERPKIGTSVCACGYPMPRLRQIPGGMIDVSGVRRYWQPTFVIDYIKQREKDGFMFQHTSLRGMSGGPVFDVNGTVYGIDVATFTRRIPQKNGTEQIVRNGIALHVKGIKSLLEVINGCEIRNDF